MTKSVLVILFGRSFKFLQKICNNIYHRVGQESNLLFSVRDNRHIICKGNVT